MWKFFLVSFSCTLEKDANAFANGDKRCCDDFPSVLTLIGAFMGSTLSQLECCPILLFVIKVGSEIIVLFIVLIRMMRNGQRTDVYYSSL